MRLTLVLLICCVATGQALLEKRAITAPVKLAKVSQGGSPDDVEGSGDRVEGSGAPVVQTIIEKPQMSSPALKPSSSCMSTSTTTPTTTTSSQKATAVPVKKGEVTTKPTTTTKATPTKKFDVGGTVVGLLTVILLVMFIVYRMRKKMIVANTATAFIYNGNGARIWKAGWAVVWTHLGSINPNHNCQGPIDEDPRDRSTEIYEQVAAITAIIKATETAMENSWFPLTIYSPCQAIVEVIRKRLRDRPPRTNDETTLERLLATLIDYVTEIRKKFDLQIKCKTANETVAKLAKEALVMPRVIPTDRFLGYTDGSVSEGRSGVGGCGIAWSLSVKRRADGSVPINRGEPFLEPFARSTEVELEAFILALKEADAEQMFPLTLRVDCTYVIESFEKDADHNRAKLLRELVADRDVRVEYEPAHKNIKGNESADEKAKSGVRKTRGYWRSNSVSHFFTSGVFMEKSALAVHKHNVNGQNFVKIQLCKKPTKTKPLEPNWKALLYGLKEMKRYHVLNFNFSKMKRKTIQAVAHTDSTELYNDFNFNYFKLRQYDYIEPDSGKMLPYAKIQRKIDAYCKKNNIQLHVEIDTVSYQNHSDMEEELVMQYGLSLRLSRLYDSEVPLGQPDYKSPPRLEDVKKHTTQIPGWREWNSYVLKREWAEERALGFLIVKSLDEVTEKLPEKLEEQALQAVTMEQLNGGETIVKINKPEQLDDVRKTAQNLFGEKNICILRTKKEREWIKKLKEYVTTKNGEYEKARRENCKRIGEKANLEIVGLKILMSTNHNAVLEREKLRASHAVLQCVRAFPGIKKTLRESPNEGAVATLREIFNLNGKTGKKFVEELSKPERSFNCPAKVYKHICLTTPRASPLFDYLHTRVKIKITCTLCNNSSSQEVYESVFDMPSGPSLKEAYAHIARMEIERECAHGCGQANHCLEKKRSPEDESQILVLRTPLHIVENGEMVKQELHLKLNSSTFFGRRWKLLGVLEQKGSKPDSNKFAAWVKNNGWDRYDGEIYTHLQGSGCSASKNAYMIFLVPYETKIQ